MAKSFKHFVQLRGEEQRRQIDSMYCIRRMSKPVTDIESEFINTSVIDGGDLDDIKEMLSIPHSRVHIFDLCFEYIHNTILKIAEICHELNNGSKVLFHIHPSMNDYMTWFNSIMSEHKEFVEIVLEQQSKFVKIDPAGNVEYTVEYCMDKDLTNFELSINGDVIQAYDVNMYICQDHICFTSKLVQHYPEIFRDQILNRFTEYIKRFGMVGAFPTDDDKWKFIIENCAE